MKRSRSSNVLSAVALLALALLIYPLVDISAARDPLRAAWDRARQSGSYTFSADIIQTTTPLPCVANVGRQSRQDALHIEGETNLPEQSLTFTLRSEGGSILDLSGGVQVRVSEDRALVRRGYTGAWEEAEDFSGLFAPDGDFMAYLVSAKDVVAQGADSRTGIQFDRYTFSVDGRSFAAHMRNQIKRDMAERGELAPGSELGLPRAYVDMTGEGELWVGEDGLPLRQILHLQFPDTGEDQVEAEVDVAFADYGPGSPANRSPFLPRRVLREVSIFAAGLGCVLLVVSLRRSRTLYTALVLAVVTSMVVTPVLQGVQAAELGGRPWRRRVRTSTMCGAWIAALFGLAVWSPTSIRFRGTIRLWSRPATARAW